jgi:hypothetical protein
VPTRPITNSNRTVFFDKDLMVAMAFFLNITLYFDIKSVSRHSPGSPCLPHATANLSGHYVFPAPLHALPPFL